MIFTTLLSLGGLPPFIGFFPKWVVIQILIINNSRFIITIMVVASLTTLYYYLRVCYSRFMILYDSPKWIPQNHSENKIIIYRVILTSASITGLLLCTMATNIN
jgi:NADH-ubiquinone oxidoreductase chain 2